MPFWKVPRRRRGRRQACLRPSHQPNGRSTGVGLYVAVGGSVAWVGPLRRRNVGSTRAAVHLNNDSH